MDDGGALCYGGVWELNGIPCAFLYAFVGGGSPRFFRYAYSLDPYRGASPRGSGWTELAQMWSNLPVKAGGCLAWCPLPGRTEHPMGLVMALRGDRTQGFYFYDPAQNEWYWPNVTFPEIVNGGAAMAAGASGYAIRFWPADRRTGREKTFCRYTYPNDHIEYCEPTPRTQEPGAALCQVGDTFYAVFGKRDTHSNRFFCYVDEDPARGGGESGHPFGTGKPEVQVRAGHRLHRFRISCPAGPVCLKVVNATGSLLACIRASAEQDGADLTWEHGPVRSGVYLYFIQTPSRLLTGKLTIVR
ncbi:MAG: hypothetical protein ABIK44_00125 [candidate division WOR-3 bacterium]